MATTIILGATVRPQAQPTAIVVTQVDYGYNIKTRKRQDHYTVRFIEIIPARTPYPKIAERLGQIVDNLHTQAAQFKARVIMYVDVTGLGIPVIDLIKAKAESIIPCYLTANDKRAEGKDRVTLGKAWLVSRLQVLFQGARIAIPRSSTTELLVQELLAYSLDPSPTDNELTSTFVVGSQDELLTALGLACQGVPKAEEAADEYLEYMRRRLQGIPTALQASKDWLKEYHGSSPVKGIDPTKETENPEPVQKGLPPLFRRLRPHG
jgi:hypothetical protein